MPLEKLVPPEMLVLPEKLVLPEMMVLLEMLVPEMLELGELVTVMAGKRMTGKSVRLVTLVKALVTLAGRQVVQEKRPWSTKIAS